MADKRIRKRKEQTDAHADHRDRVKERDDEEHLHPQHRCEFRLTRSTLEEAGAPVRNYLSEAIVKLGAANRIDAARIARGKGWL